MIELIGYIASAIVLTSFLMKNINYLRIINSSGCMVFILYGILKDFSIPIIVSNLGIAVINIYFLIKTNSKKEA